MLGRSALLTAAGGGGGDPWFGSVSLLLKGDGTNNSTTISDSSSNNVAITRFGDTKISTAQFKFRGSSIYFDGAGDYLTPSSSALFALAGDFTVEAWIRPAALSNWCGIIGIGTVSVSRLMLRLNSSGQVEAWLNGYSNVISSSASAVATNTWSHVALVRSGSGTNNLKLYINGSSAAQGTTTYSILQDIVTIGRGYADLNSEYYTGYIGDLRITKGIARYQSSFTPSTAPFPDFS